MIAIFPVRNTIRDYINGRNEKVFAAIFLVLFLFIFGQQQFVDQYPEIRDYDLNNPEDKMLVDFHKTSITVEEMEAYKILLANLKRK